MQLTLPQVLGLVLRALHGTSPNLAVNTVLRAMDKIVTVTRANNSLKQLKIDIPDGVPPDLDGWQPKKRREGCSRCP